MTLQSAPAVAASTALVVVEMAVMAEGWCPYDINHAAVFSWSSW